MITINMMVSIIHGETVEGKRIITYGVRQSQK